MYLFFLIPQATNIKTGLHYCLYRIHGYRLSNVKVTQLVDLWKKIQHSSVTQLREVFTTKAFNDNCKSWVYKSGEYCLLSVDQMITNLCFGF